MMKNNKTIKFKGAHFNRSFNFSFVYFSQSGAIRCNPCRKHTSSPVQPKTCQPAQTPPPKPVSVRKHLTVFYTSLPKPVCVRMHLTVFKPIAQDIFFASAPDCV